MTIPNSLFADYILTDRNIDVANGSQWLVDG
jgi:hypothetical protein